MKSSNISFYFVLYLVAIITVFVITSERDQLLRQRDEDIAHLIEVYVKPLHLSAYADTTRFLVETGADRTTGPVRIRVKADGPIDREDISYTIVSAHELDGGAIESGSVHAINDGGDGVIIAPPLEPGLYAFSLAGYKKRLIQDGNRMRVVIRDTTYEIQASRRLERVDHDTVVVFARVEKTGMTPPALTLNVPEANDSWVIGPSYTKKVFVGGIQDLASLSTVVEGPGRIERPPEGGAFLLLVWDRPTMGRQSFSISANAHRGLGEKDRARISFSVQVYPAAFTTPPSSRAFWGIPYIFDGQIAGLNPLDVNVEASHDGQTLATKPVVPPDTILPQPSWNSLTFRVLYRGTVIKEHHVTLEPPPPPQIRWIQQNFDPTRKVFVIVAESNDPLGGPVTIALTSEPSGIASIDKIRGTRFTVTVDLRTNPSAIFLKLISMDRFGGRAVSAKQFNIPR
jgi:hypothetical protein